jgi:2-oxoglutarate ferredoxin oxidoreductase subunit alpha
VRDEVTLARPWAIPGTPGLEHRVGGIEKQDGSGNISYQPSNHQLMVDLRAAKIAGIATDVPAVVVDSEGPADTLVIGWGSTWSSINAGVYRCRAQGLAVDQAHLVHVNPFPANLGDVLKSYRKVLVPEMNLGQLSRLLRAEYLIDAQSFTQVNGLPFRAVDMETRIKEVIEQ